VLYDDISMSCDFGSSGLASTFLLRYLMSHMLLYPVVHISHFWCRILGLVDISMTNPFLILLSHAYINQVI